MPKKDTSSAVLGMLSSAGAQTRPTVRTAPPTPADGPIDSPATDFAGDITDDALEPTIPKPEPDPRPQATVSTLPSPPPAGEKDAAPRTLRLRPATAQALRDAWLAAKRDDVLLTAQDFASKLVDEALVRRHTQQLANSR